MIAYIIIAVVLLLIVCIILSYNKLVRGKNMVEEAFATMDVYLKKRFDLIPNLVETVKEYARHESDTLEKVIAARNDAEKSEDIVKRAQAESDLDKTLRNIWAISEDYPELKANANFIDLQEQLQKVEEDIANSRKYYNAVVRNYNNDIMMVPTNVVAGIFHFKKVAMFEVADDIERENIKVNF